MNNVFLSRIKSFAWRLGNFAVISILGWIADNLASLNLDPTVIAIISAFIALITSEFTKWWANKQASLGKTFFGRAKKI